MMIFYSLEVVGRGSETQLQVGENLNFKMLRVKGNSEWPVADNTSRWQHQEGLNIYRMYSIYCSEKLKGHICLLVR